MKKYIVNSTYGNKTKTELTPFEYLSWLKFNAKRNYNYYRIVGDETSNHFYVDFDNMWEVTVVEKDEEK